MRRSTFFIAALMFAATLAPTMLKAQTFTGWRMQGLDAQNSRRATWAAGPRLLTNNLWTRNLIPTTGQQISGISTAVVRAGSGGSSDLVFVAVYYTDSTSKVFGFNATSGVDAWAGKPYLGFTYPCSQPTLSNDGSELYLFVTRPLQFFDGRADCRISGILPSRAPSDRCRSREWGPPLHRPIGWHEQLLFSPHFGGELHYHLGGKPAGAGRKPLYAYGPSRTRAVCS